MPPHEQATSSHPIEKDSTSEGISDMNHLLPDIAAIRNLSKPISPTISEHPRAKKSCRTPQPIHEEPTIAHYRRVRVAVSDSNEPTLEDLKTQLFEAIAKTKGAPPADRPALRKQSELITGRINRLKRQGDKQLTKLLAPPERISVVSAERFGSKTRARGRESAAAKKLRDAEDKELERQAQLIDTEIPPAKYNALTKRKRKLTIEEEIAEDCGLLVDSEDEQDDFEGISKERREEESLSNKGGRKKVKVVEPGVKRTRRKRGEEAREVRLVGETLFEHFKKKKLFSWINQHTFTEP